MHLGNALQLTQHQATNVKAGGNGGILRKIQQHRGEQVILVIQTHAADEISAVLTFRQPATSLTAGALLRQHPHRGAARTAITEGICMNGNKQIGLHVARLLHTLAQTDVIVAGADHHRPHAALLADQPFQPARDGQHHILFPRAVTAGGPRIVTAVTGVDGDDHIAHLAGRRLHATLRHRRFAARLLQVDHQTVAVFLRRLEQEAFRLHLATHVQHHTQVAIVRSAAHAVHEAFAEIQPAQVMQQAGILDVHHHPLGGMKHKELVADRAVKVENQAVLIRAGPQANALNRCRRDRQRQHQRQQNQ